MCGDKIELLAELTEEEWLPYGGARIYSNSDNLVFMEYAPGHGKGVCWDDDPNIGERPVKPNEILLYKFPVKKDLPDWYDRTANPIGRWCFGIGEELTKLSSWQIWLLAYKDLIEYYGATKFDSSPFLYKVEELELLWKKES